MRTSTTPKKTTELIRDLDTIFSIFIRLRDAGQDGKIKCFVCSSSVFWRHSHAGHYISRSAMATRYNELNVNAICESCNCFDDDHAKEYFWKMVEKIGLHEVSELTYEGKSISKLMPFEYLEKIEHYKSEVAKLRKQKNI